MAEVKSNKNTIYCVHIVIYLMIMFGIGFLPPFGQITEMGMKVLGVFLGTIYGWITLSLTWTSIGAMVALSLCGYTTITAAFGSGFGYYLVPLLIVTFVFAAAVNKTGVTEWLTEWFVSRKIIVGRPYAFMVVLLLGMELLAVLGASFVGLILMWNMVVTLAEKAGLEKHNPFTSFMIPSLTVIFVIAGFILPFHGGPVMYFGFFAKGTGLTIPELPYMAWMLVFVNLYIAILMLAAKFIFRLNLSEIAIALEAYRDKKCSKMNRLQAIGLTMLVTFVVVLLAPSFMPAEMAVAKLITGLGIVGVASILLIILFALRNPDGSEFVTVTEASRGISWDVIWLIVATTPLAAAFEAEECGIMTTIMGFLVPILTNLSPTFFVIICTVVLGIATQFIHNLILAIVFIPILCPLCMQIGGNPYACFLGIYVALTYAFATPAASMNAALIFGHKAMAAKEGYIHGVMHLVLALILVIAVGLPLAGILF